MTLQGLIAHSLLMLNNTALSGASDGQVCTERYEVIPHVQG